MKKIIFAIIIAVASVSMVSAQAQFGIRSGFNSSTYKLGVEKFSPSINFGNNPGFYFGMQVNVPIGEIFAFQPEVVYSYDGTKLGVSKSFFKDLAAYAKDNGASLDEVKFIKGIGALSSSIIMHNVSVPLLFKLSPSKSLGIMAGPYVSYNVKAGLNLNDNLKDLLKDEAHLTTKEIGVITDTADELLKVNINKLGVGVSFGAEYAFDCGLFIEARYNLGLLNSLKKEYDFGVFVDIDFYPDDDGDGVPDIPMKGEWKDLIAVQPALKYSSFQIGIGFRF